jgi:hypothetical protein
MQVFREVDVERIARIYTRDRVGVQPLPSLIDPHFSRLLADELMELERTGQFLTSVERIGKVEQHLSTVQFLNGERVVRFSGGIIMPPEIDFTLRTGHLPMLSLYAHAFTEQIYNPVAEMIGFPRVPVVNSIAVHLYPALYGGIEYHYDNTTEVNMIAAANLVGRGQFRYSRKKPVRSSRLVEMKPTDVVIMRGLQRPGRPEREKDDNRPAHKIKAITMRLAVILRNYVPLEKKDNASRGNS